MFFHQLADGFHHFPGFGHRKKFYLRYSPTCLDKYVSVIKKCRKNSPAFEADILNFIQVCLGKFFVEQVDKVDIDNTPVGDDIDIELPPQKTHDGYPERDDIPKRTTDDKVAGRNLDGQRQKMQQKREYQNRRDSQKPDEQYRRHQDDRVLPQKQYDVLTRFLRLKPDPFGADGKRRQRRHDSAGRRAKIALLRSCGGCMRGCKYCWHRKLLYYTRSLFLNIIQSALEGNFSGSTQIERFIKIVSIYLGRPFVRLKRHTRRRAAFRI